MFTSVLNSSLNIEEGIVGVDLGQTGLDNFETENNSTSCVSFPTNKTSCLVWDCTSRSFLKFSPIASDFPSLYAMLALDVILNSTSNTILGELIVFVTDFDLL